MSVSAEMNTRVTQYQALLWTWRLLRKETKSAATEKIYSKLNLLLYGNDVDFEELIKELEEGP